MMIIMIQFTDKYYNRENLIKCFLEIALNHK